MVKVVPCRLPLDDVEDESGVKEPAEVVSDVLVFRELATCAAGLLDALPDVECRALVRIPPLLPLEPGLSKQFLIFFTRLCTFKLGADVEGNDG